MPDQFDALYEATEKKAVELEAAVVALESTGHEMAAELAAFHDRQQDHHDRLEQARVEFAKAVKALHALRGAREAIGVIAATATAGTSGRKGG